MFARLFLLFTIVTLVELFLIVTLFRATGLLTTILLVIGTGAVGAAMARAQGVRVLQNIQRSVYAGRMPADEMIEGVILLMGGALLVTPGILTDIVGFLTLIPPVRAAFRKALRRYCEDWIRRNASTGVFVQREEPHEPSDPFDDFDDRRFR